MMSRLCRCLGLLLGTGLMAPLAAQPIPEVPNTAFFLGQFENDIFVWTDRYYTNAARISYWSPDMTLDVPAHKRGPSWVIEEWGERLGLVEDRQDERRVGWSLGQNLYTPSDLTIAEYLPNERPYAAWLYGSAGLLTVDNGVMRVWELSLGVVGPWALGESVQDFVHDVVFGDDPQGWDNQIGNEVTVMLRYDYQKLVDFWDSGDWRAEFIPQSGVMLGNVFTQAYTGGRVRLGWREADSFPVSPILLPANAPVSTEPDNNFGWHASTSLGGRVHAVLWNIFLDGNTFADGPSINKEIIVGEFFVDFTLRYRNWRLTYQQILRTKEFSKQDTAQGYASVTLSRGY